MILLDTNAIIKQVQDTDLDSLTERRAISVITYIELMSIKNENNISKMKLLLAGFFIAQLTEGIVEQSIRIRRQYSIKTPDAIIAATAMQLKIPLVSGDFVFRKIIGLRLITSI